jgi:hypothetical protein
MEKQLENPEKKKKAKQPSRPSEAARPRHLIGGCHLSAAVSAATLPPPSLCPVGPTCRRKLYSPPRAPLPALPRGLVLPGAESLPRAPLLSLSLRRGPSLSAPPSLRPSWTSERALTHVIGILGHVALPTRPSSFLSPVRARTHSPASFHAVLPSLALCSRR